MDTERIIEMHIAILEGKQDDLRLDFADVLGRIGDDARSGAHRKVWKLSTLEWIEARMAKLLEIRKAFDATELARDTLCRVFELTDGEVKLKANQKAMTS